MLYPFRTPRHSLDLRKLSLKPKMLRGELCPKVKRVFLISSSRDEMTELTVHVDLIYCSVLSQTTVDKIMRSSSTHVMACSVVLAREDIL
jgi:hypothetical protein